MKCRAPCCHSRCRSLTRKLATIIRTRLCIQPVARSWRMPASTIGNPVRPSFQASRAAHPARRTAWRANSGRRYSRAVCGRCEEHVGVELPPGELAAVRRGALAAACPEVGQHRARVDLAPLEVHATSGWWCRGRGGRARRRSRPGAPRRTPATAERRGLAGLRQLDAGGQRRPRAGRRCRRGTASRTRSGASTGSRQPCSGPALGERRVDLVRRAGAVPDPVRARRRTATRCAPARCRARRAPASTSRSRRWP